MTENMDISNVLNEWSPELADRLTTLSYIGSAASTRWLTNSPRSQEFSLLMSGEGYNIAIEMWHKVLKSELVLPAPILLVILEHMRRRPFNVLLGLQKRNLAFSRTIANISFRAAGALYEEAKDSFASHEIDVAVGRFRLALSEFRFAIESSQLSDATLKIATGKYAAAVAMIGRWVNVSIETVLRALQYSKESMALGNKRAETLMYCLELQVLYYDQSGDAASLNDAFELLAGNRSIAVGAELVEAEVKYRFSILHKSNPAEHSRYLVSARANLARSRSRGKGTVEDARCNVLTSMIEDAERGGPITSARLAAIPRGLLAQMAIKPSLELWKAIRRIIRNLEPLRNAGSVPAAVLSARYLRQIVDGPEGLIQKQDLSMYVEITKWLAENAPYNRHVRWEAGAAALSAAKRSGKRDLALRAQEIFNFLTILDPKWPLPRIGIARVRDYLYFLSGNRGGYSASSWREASKLALSSPNYARSNLGGRNEVFAVADARGFLSETFVFKRTTKPKAEHEASMLNALRAEIDKRGCNNIYEVPRSLAIVEVPSEDERKWVHVTQRSAGQILSEISGEEASQLLEPIVDLLALFHRVAGEPPAGKSAWRPLKDYLKMWSRALFDPEQADAFVDSLRKSFPTEFRLVRKRDGHASNWLIDPAGRIVAIDFESVEFIPAGYDVAQLIEDNALVSPNAEGWYRRLAIMARYLGEIGHEVAEEALISAYGWFCLTRALRLGTERQAGKSLRRHAREICGMLMEFGDVAMQIMAKELLHALSRIDQAEPKESNPSHDHRRLSKAMAYQLRHHGPSNGVAIDEAGFASMDDLAFVLEVDSSHLLAVAEHPGEPRFQVREGNIRALYGHSLPVNVDVGIKVEAPASLYHGSSWSVLDLILAEGLKPMNRHRVHLTNIAGEAMAVGGRKGAAILLSIEQSHDEEPIAEGIWVAKSIERNRLSVLNPFGDEAGTVQ